MSEQTRLLLDALADIAETVGKTPGIAGETYSVSGHSHAVRLANAAIDRYEASKTHWGLDAARSLRGIILTMPVKDGPLGRDHLIFMLDRMDENMSVGKLNRWLGWIQASIVASGRQTLDFMKSHNKYHMEMQQ